MSETSLNRMDHQRPLGEECLQKEPFLINHYYSHPLVQCCCQQHGVTVKMGEAIVQCNTFLLHKKSENLHKSQQPSETKPGIDVMYPVNYNTTEKQEHRIP